MFNTAFDDLILEDLITLVEARTPEGRQLEYKRDHYGRNDDARREFAADVSALANSRGGYLLIGIAEDSGSASALTGVEVEDADALVRSASDALRTSIEPPLQGLRMRCINIAPGRGVLIIKVERSRNAPHRVTVSRDSRFFLRDENGKRPMSVEELKRAFLFATEIEERVRRFRVDRLTLLGANEGPLGLREDRPHLIIHLVPEATFTEGLQFSFSPRTTGLVPMGSRGWNSMHSLDGLVTYCGQEERLETVRAFSTLFRNGVAEMAADVFVDPDGTISLSGVESGAMEAVEQALNVLSKHGAPRPIYLMLSIVGVRGLSARLGERYSTLVYPHRSDRVILPEFLIDQDISDDVAAALRPQFDLMWNAFGHGGSPNYDAKGRYTGRY